MLSIIIPTFNRLPYIRPTLIALLRQKTSVSVEIIVIDSGSDDTGDMIKNEFPAIRYHHVGQEKNRALLRNRGAELATGTHLLFMDNDMIAPEGYLEGHIQHLGKKQNAVVLGRRRSLEDFSADIPEVLYRDSTELLSRLPWLADERTQDLLETGGDISSVAAPWRFCYSHGLSVSRDLFFRAGQFDEQFGLNWGFEDVELGYRLFLCGAEFFMLDNLDVYHQPHDTQSVGNRDQADVNRIIFRDKHNSGPAEMVCCFGPNVGELLATVEAAVAENPADFIPPSDFSEDLVLGCYLSPFYQGSCTKASLGVYLPPSFQPETVRVVRGFFRLPHVVQCFILFFCFT